MTAHLRRRSLAAVAIVAGAAILIGCAPNIENLVRNSLAGSIEDAQDSMWEHRGKIVTDPATTIAELSLASDLRDGTDELDGNPVKLLALNSTDEGTTLTLLASGGAQTGGGWWYTQREAAVCFTLTFPRGEELIETGPADCPNIPVLDGIEDIVPLGELDVRLTTTRADYADSVCQCYSGSECDCPGG
jgi:hypothetical protein